MILIKKLGTRISKSGYLESWGLFLCPYCLQEVIKRLSSGKIAKSCGCIPTSYKHGEGYETKLYNSWRSMKQRILNPNSKSYKDYGGRGITICNEWLEFIPFRDWSLSNNYQECLTIDRINNNGNYEPTNCRWVTRTENSRNKSTTKLNKEKVLEIRTLHNSGYYTQKQLAEKYKINKQTLNDFLLNKTWKNI